MFTPSGSRTSGVSAEKSWSSRRRGLSERKRVLLWVERADPPPSCSSGERSGVHCNGAGGGCGCYCATARGPFSGAFIKTDDLPTAWIDFPKSKKRKKRVEGPSREEKKPRTLSKCSSMCEGAAISGKPSASPLFLQDFRDISVFVLL